ncbi:SOS response-associated peptidase [Leucobacter allii]|uniref:SOS response-associated peptidase n=1 Tax=Leucobacter allii TaxID=2932247 RepID=A0ABY4FPX0_9MICO|nr:SOS response-associated peptidase family protein [Leucobacter allii]UOQ58302.1 SOS response-associated peptidase [Leucobacter allii]UOR02881.1 SOS response-associated peptidase [Leucobacter allii]
MCASYGLGGGPHRVELTFDLPPMHEPESRETIARWAREQGSTARITGRRARNLNPLIHRGRGEPVVELAWWWLHVGGAPAPFSAFNARDDALLRSWRAPLQRRAILPAHWYVEQGGIFAMPGDELFGIAAIVTPVPQAAGEPLLSYAMVTRAAVGAAAEIHPRMPLVLPRTAHAAWLDPARPGDAALVAETVAASDGAAAEVLRIDEAAATGFDAVLF